LDRTGLPVVGAIPSTEELIASIQEKEIPQ